jgi:hypothetical protein
VVAMEVINPYLCSFALCDLVVHRAARFPESSIWEVGCDNEKCYSPNLSSSPSVSATDAALTSAML